MYIESFLSTAESYIINWLDNEGCIHSQNTQNFIKVKKKLMEEKGGI